MVTLVNRAKMSTSTTGTGTITLGSAEDGYQSFADAGVADGDVVRYVIEDGDDWEIGSGTYTASGTTLSRTVDESSNSDAALNLTGSAVVFITAAAEDVFQGELFAESTGTFTAPTANAGNSYNSVAIGNGADIGSGRGESIAIGTDALTNQSQAISLGKAATVGSGGSFATALGRNSLANGTSATAIGTSYASGTDSFAAAITTNSSSYGATAYNAIAMGQDARATSANGIALGRQTTASNLYATAIGYVNTASGQYSAALGGRGASASGNYSVVLGGFSNAASGSSSLVGGYDSTASHSNSIVFGDTASSSAANEITLGSTSDTVRISSAYTLPTSDGTANQVLTTDGSGAVTFADASSIGGSTGVDFNDNVKARFGTGNDLEIYHNGTSSIIENTSAGQYLRIRSAGGIQFTTSGTENALIGIQDSKVGLYYDGSEKLETTSSGIQTTGTVNVNGAYTLPTSDGTNGQVLTTDGSGAVTFADAASFELYAENASSPTANTVTGSNSVAIGENLTVSGDNSLASGTGGTATGYSSFAFGDGADATGNHSVAIGGGAIQASGAQSIAIGYGSDATNTDAHAFGRNANASGSSATALGRDAVASTTRAVALGDSRANGVDSLAAAIADNSSSYGVTATNGIAIGKLAKASGSFSTAIGESTQATASNSTSIGYFNQSTGQGSVTLGYDAQATGTQATALGLASRNAINGSLKFAGGKHQASGDAQAGLYPLMAETTDATQTTMVTYHNNSATASTNNQIIANADTAVSFLGTVVGKQSGSANVAAFKIEGVLVNNGGTTTLVNSAITVLDNTPSWALALSADDTNDALSVKVTGAAATSIRWLANIQTAEVKYA